MKGHKEMIAAYKRLLNWSVINLYLKLVICLVHPGILRSGQVGVKEVDLKTKQPSKPKELNPKLCGSIMSVCEIIGKHTKNIECTNHSSWLCAKHNFQPDPVKYQRLTTSCAEQSVLNQFVRCTCSLCSNADFQKEKLLCFG